MRSTDSLEGTSLRYVRSQLRSLSTIANQLAGGYPTLDQGVKGADRYGMGRDELLCATNPVKPHNCSQVCGEAPIAASFV